MAWLHTQSVLDSVQSTGDNSFGTSSFGARSRVEFTLPRQGIENLYWAFRPFRQSEQLFVCISGHTKGSPVTKQRLSKWIIDIIALAYSFLGQQFPMRVRAHSTRGVTSSWVCSNGVSIAEIYAATSWASPSILARFSRTSTAYFAVLCSCMAQSSLQSK